MNKKSGKNHQIPSELSEPVVITDKLDLHGFFPEQAVEVMLILSLTEVCRKFEEMA
ncbi:hypothetical protein J7K93_02375 [bacterium]|nr:hypothetical protein [bacterium]